MGRLELHVLRHAFGHYATGVAVITTHSVVGRHVGVTVNSFSSVSLDPPLISFALARSANILTDFQHAKSFAVNILSRGQLELSNIFARPSTASWQDVEFTQASNGCALLQNCLAQLECDKASALDGGDHLIVLGLVRDIHVHGTADPLLFYCGTYGTYTRDWWSKFPPVNGSLPELLTGWE